MSDWWTLDATAQAALIAAGRVSARAVVAEALERAVELAELAATTVLLEERALERAGAAGSAGPFAGVPILLKDGGQQLAGTPHWIGTTALRSIEYRSTTTTTLTSQLERLGFIIIGKAAVPELMTGITTEPPIAPPTRNPWDRSLTVGGSSGGSAAAVAAGIVAVAHGSDSTGSLRYPASCCGVYSLKPTAGRVASQLPADLDDPIGHHVDFVLSRSVRDLRGVLAGLSPDGGRPPPSGSTPRIALLDAMPFGLPLAPEVGRALTETADLLSNHCEVTMISPDFLERFGAVIGADISTLVAANRAAAVRWIEDLLGRAATTTDLSPDVLDAAARGRSLATGELAAARARIETAAHEAARAASGVEALLLPILAIPPWPIGSPEPDGRLAGLVCSLASFAGQPSVVIPTVQDEVPIGVQLQGPRGADEWLLDLAAEVRPVAPRPPGWPS